MSVYFLVNIRIKDEQEYQLYLDRAEDIFSRYNGSYLAVDKQPDVIEGKWEYSRAVLIQFEDKADFKAWYQSADYQEILQYRLSASDCDGILIQGK